MGDERVASSRRSVALRRVSVADRSRAQNAAEAVICARAGPAGTSDRQAAVRPAVAETTGNPPAGAPGSVPPDAPPFTVHARGTYVCMEGPAFSTRAESLMHRLWGGDVIGMTAMPEAKLVREAELGYAIVAMVTDFDCWNPEHDHVDVAQVVAVARRNAGAAARLIARFARSASITSRSRSSPWIRTAICA